MQLDKINSFSSFCAALRKAGFSMGGRNDEGVFSLFSFFGDNIVDHTGDKETDPWEWRIRGITECNDLAYAKLFFNKGGWITREWYPLFMAVRRGRRSFKEHYLDGEISSTAKTVYERIVSSPNISLHEIKVDLESDKIEAALTQLQMKMFITISGQKSKLSKEGKEYGWPVTTFCTPETFFGAEITDCSCEIDPQDAVDSLSNQIFLLNPAADKKSVPKFIGK